MKVILTQDVRGQGKKGQLIDAAEATQETSCCPASSPCSPLTPSTP